MRKKGLVTFPVLEPVVLEAEPKPLEIDLQRMAVMVIDMENAFVSKGGLFDLLGFDLSNNQKCIEPIRKVNSAARAKGVKVIYVAHRLSPDLREIGPNSPYWYRGESLSYREHPEWRDKLTVRGTWGAEIIDELKPQAGDIVVEKQRYSAFFATNLDMILRTHNIKYLAFAGVTISICVEASLRDAFYLEYFPILISDAAATPGPPFRQDAVISNVKSCYGWVTTSANLAKAME